MAWNPSSGSTTTRGFLDLPVHLPVQAYHNFRAQLGLSPDVTPESIKRCAFSEEANVTMMFILFSTRKFKEVLARYPEPAASAAVHAYAYVCAIAAMGEKTKDVWFVTPGEHERFHADLCSFFEARRLPPYNDQSTLGLLAVPIVLSKEQLPNFAVESEYDFFIRHIMPVLSPSYLIHGELEDLKVDCPETPVVDPAKCIYSPALSALIDPYCGISHGVFGALIDSDKHLPTEPWFYPYQFLKPGIMAAASHPIQFGIVQGDGSISWQDIGSTFILDGKMIKSPAAPARAPSGGAGATASTDVIRILLTVRKPYGIVPIALDSSSFEIPVTGFSTYYTLFMPGGNGISTRDYQLFQSLGGGFWLAATGRVRDEDVHHVSPMSYDVGTGYWVLEAWALFNHAPAPGSAPAEMVTANGAVHREGSSITLKFNPDQSGLPLNFDYGWRGEQAGAMIPFLKREYPPITIDASGKLNFIGESSFLHRSRSEELAETITGYAAICSEIEAAATLKEKFGILQRKIMRVYPDPKLHYKAFMDIFLSGDGYFPNSYNFRQQVMAHLNRGFADLPNDGRHYPPHVLQALGLRSFLPKYVLPMLETTARAADAHTVVISPASAASTPFSVGSPLSVAYGTSTAMVPGEE